MSVNLLKGWQERLERVWRDTVRSLGSARYTIDGRTVSAEKWDAAMGPFERSFDKALDDMREGLDKLVRKKR